MKNHIITEKHLHRYAAWLREEERGSGTVEKYLRDVTAYGRWLAGRAAGRESLTQWREHLVEAHYAPVTVNSMLAAVHQFFACMGWQNCRVKYVRIQRRMFREPRRELGRRDYEKLCSAAREHGMRQLLVLLETMASTGIRVSEVRYITLEAARRGCAEIALKGKLRRILLPGKLCRVLLRYAKEQKIAAGELFLAKSGKSLDRRRIWAALKALARRAGVDPARVFPHNLRHLFAVTFYKVCGDISKLADVLGHSSMETTRLYLITTGREHARLLERLRLIS